MASYTGSQGGNVSAVITTSASNISRSGNTVSADIYVSWKMSSSTYTYNSVAAWILASGTKYPLFNSSNGAYHTNAGQVYSTTVRYTWTGIGDTQTSLSYNIGFGWNAWNPTQGNTQLWETISFPANVVWNDINAWNPSQTEQNGLIFDLATSDGGRWYNLTNEPSASDFTKVIGTTATVSNIRSNITGAHYSGNSITNNTASSFSWTFNTANFIAAMYTAWDTYTVTYNANGGTGAPSNQTKTYGQTLTLSNTIPARTGYTFKKWNTSSDGTGTDYNSGSSYLGNAPLSLYAQWQINTYTVTYNANGGTGAPENQTKTYGINLKLSSTIPTRSGYTFKGWATSASTGTVSYNPGDTYTLNNVLNLYAVWEEILYYDFHLNLIDPSGTVRTDGTAGTVDISIDGGTYQTVSKEINSSYIYGTLFNFKNVSPGIGMVLKQTSGVTYNADTGIYSATQPKSSLTINFTMDYNQLKIKTDNSTWKSGKGYIKVNGVWKPASKVYIKVNGEWKQISY